MQAENSSLRFYAFMRWKLNDSATKIHEDIKLVFGDVVALRTVQNYVRQFKDGRATVTDLRVMNSRPIASNHDELVCGTKRLLEADQNLTVDEISDELGSCHGTIHHIIQHDLNLKSVCQKWVPHQLSPEMKLNRIARARDWLTVFQRQGAMDSVVMVDEKWFYYRGIGSHRSHRCWVSADGDSKLSQPTHIVKRNQFERKSHVIIGVSMNGYFHFEIVERNRNVDSERYVTFLQNMNAKLSRYGRPLTYTSWIFIHDNARPHTSQFTCEFLNEKGVNKVPQPPYSPDFNILDRFVNKFLSDRQKQSRFQNEQELNDFVMTQLRHIPASAWANEKVKLLRDLQEIIRIDGDYL